MCTTCSRSDFPKSQIQRRFKNKQIIDCTKQRFATSFAAGRVQKAIFEIQKIDFPISGPFRVRSPSRVLSLGRDGPVIALRTKRWACYAKKTITVTSDKLKNKDRSEATKIREAQKLEMQTRESNRRLTVRIDGYRKWMNRYHSTRNAS